MSLALVRLEKKRGDKIYYFIDYISTQVAKLGIDIQGAEHGKNEYSKPKIIRIHEGRK